MFSIYVYTYKYMYNSQVVSNFLKVVVVVVAAFSEEDSGLLGVMGEVNKKSLERVTVHLNTLLGRKWAPSHFEKFSKLD